MKADNSKLAASLGQTQRQTVSAFQGIASQIKGLLSASAITAVGRNLVQGVQQSIRLAERQIDAEQRVAAVVKSTGQAAGFTAKQLQDQAAALQKVTTVGDEAILETQAVLLTFKAVSGDAFNRTTESALDLAAVLGTDAKSGALQLGKAMEDPIRGITALRRAGVSFTEAEKEQIKIMQESGRLREAQEVVLKGVEGQIKGVARALAETDSGKLKQARNVMGDMREELGKRLIPASLAWMQIQMGLLEAIEPIIKFVGDLTAGIGELGLSGAFKVLGGVVLGMIGVWVAYTLALKAVIAAKAIVLALSGPKGWIVLAGAAAAATLAIEGANKAIRQTGKDTKELSAEAQKIVDSVQKRADKIRAKIFKADTGSKKAGGVLGGMNEELFQLTNNLSDAQIALREFGQTEGVSEQQIKQFEALRSEIDKTKARMEAAADFAKEQESAAKRIEDRGRGLTESLRTPLEQFKAEIAEINQLLHLGAITEQTAARAAAQAKEGLPQPEQGPTRSGFRDLGKQIQDKLLQRETITLQKKEIKLEEDGNKTLDGILKAIIDKDRETVLS